MHRFL